jgi:uncharacterized protein (TIGR02996 family)
MPGARPFLDAIRAAPDDDAPRLVYADWLEENGPPERAEFIRIQCELARRESPALRRRETELLAAHHDAFAGPLAASHLRFRFERGFIVGFGHTGVFLEVQRAVGWYSMLRFFPHGLVTSIIATDLENIPAFLEDSYPNTGSTRYALDSFADPASTRLEFGFGRHPKEQGVLDCNSLTLIRRNRRHFDHLTNYTHHPVPGFDSFPET